ncbi:MAG: glucosaminidase domain-containing protein [Sphingobacteriales bacterium]|nr:glucosaminidase domain-containing protein [Sphingobacteriales bacterium]
MERVLLYCIAFIVILSYNTKSYAQITSEEQAEIDSLAVLYINQYQQYAISEMYRTGIPASIKLAQALHETNYGRSRLAVLANNHFGAKCHNTWFGATISYTDDRPNECFRKYESVYESYINHAKILEKDRYKFLFRLDRSDYKGWCFGLKTAGYATDPRYAGKLINIIERYRLHLYDFAQNGEYIAAYSPTQSSFVQTADAIVAHTQQPVPREQYVLSALQTQNTPTIPAAAIVAQPHAIPKYLGYRPIQYINGAEVVTYRHPVYPAQIAEKYNCDLDKLLDWNDIQTNDTIAANTPIYLAERRSKSDKKYKKHEVQKGETIEQVALKYGVKTGALRERNHLEAGEELAAGTVLYLRKKAPHITEITKETAPASTTAIAPKKEDTQNQSEQQQVHGTRQNSVVPPLPKQSGTPTTSTKINPATTDTPRKLAISYPPQGTKIIIRENTIAYHDAQSDISGPAVTAHNFPANTTPAAAPVVDAPAATPAGVPMNERLYHKVTAGDTLFSLAKRYQCSIDYICSMNSSIKKNKIVAGSLLRVR